jgi:hypothetical protein
MMRPISKLHPCPKCGDVDPSFHCNKVEGVTSISIRSAPGVIIRGNKVSNAGGGNG